MSELTVKGYECESTGSFVILVLLVPKKDKMCVDGRNVIVKYKHPIPRLDDMLGELYGSCVFLKN